MVWCIGVSDEGPARATRGVCKVGARCRRAGREAVEGAIFSGSGGRLPGNPPAADMVPGPARWDFAVGRSVGTNRHANTPAVAGTGDKLEMKGG